MWLLIAWVALIPLGALLGYLRGNTLLGLVTTTLYGPIAILGLLATTREKLAD